MKKSLKITCLLVAVTVFAYSCTCNSPNNNKSGTDTLKTDSVKVDSAKKPATDTTIKKDSTGTSGSGDPGVKHPPGS